MSLNEPNPGALHVPLIIALPAHRSAHCGPGSMETLGGFHSGAVAQVRLLASALARSKGSDEREASSQLFGRLSLNLMRGNALMLSSRHQDRDIPQADIDGIE